MISAPLSLSPAGRLRLVSPLCILFWLIVHPAAWQRHLALIDPSLPLDFSLIELTARQRRNPQLARFLLFTWLSLGLWIAFLIPLLSSSWATH